jgi:3-deoxy-manno-octulosonate cytidylyltransferase (CMP-KDO synthetase)
MTKIIAVIPARMGSSRFPGKPLALILGRTMIEHIFRRAKMCSLLNEVFIATCDEEIRMAAENFGGKVLMTSSAHERASDRVAEAAKNLKAEIIVMIQGDEPMVTAAMIEAAVAPMIEDSTINCVNLVQPITSREEFLDRNTIKVVKNLNGDALYFSRSPIPSIEFSENNSFFKQVCIIPFRREFLQKFSALLPTPLEQAESIDMLRVIEHGEKVRMVETATQTHAVDTPEDLLLVKALMKNDWLIDQDETEEAK